MLLSTLNYVALETENFLEKLIPDSSWKMRIKDDQETTTGSLSCPSQLPYFLEFSTKIINYLIKRKNSTILWLCKRYIFIRIIRYGLCAKGKFRIRLKYSSVSEWTKPWGSGVFLVFTFKPDDKFLDIRNAELYYTLLFTYLIHELVLYFSSSKKRKVKF